MNDINWHKRGDADFYDLLIKFKGHTILVETDITFRIDNSSHYCDFTGKLKSCDEILLRYAFIE
jgi:hypothetical protein